MSRDEILNTDPARSTAARTILMAAIAFVAGLAVMGLVALFYWNRDASLGATSRMSATEIERAAQPAAPPGTDISALYARETELAGKIAQLEGRLATIDADSRGAAGYAARAEGLLIAFAARRALDRGLPLGYVEVQLNQRFRDIAPTAVGTIIQTSREPVTLEDLRLALDTMAPRLMTGSPNDSFWTKVRRQLNMIVVIRQEGSPSPRAADRLTRVHRLLDAGHVEAAMAEVARLPGAGHGTSWIAAATRYVEARRALNTIELAAIQGRSGQPQDTAPDTPPVVPVN